MRKTIEQAREKRQQSINQLYRRIPGFNKVVRVYSEPVHNAKMGAIEEQYQADVAGIIADLSATMAHARKVIAASESTLANGGKNYSWLTPGELERANTISLFVREDVEALDPPALVDFVKQASESDDKVTRWAALRFASERWQSFPDDDISPITWASWDKAYPALRESVAPADVIKAEKTARANLAQAEEIYEAARYELPAERQRLADRLGISEAAMFPDQAQPLEPAEVASDAEIREWQRGIEKVIAMKQPRSTQPAPQINIERIMQDARRGKQERAPEPTEAP